MLVKFKNTWFGPTQGFDRDKSTHIQGRRYRKGEHQVDPALREHLPSSAEVLDEAVFVPPPAPIPVDHAAMNTLDRPEHHLQVLEDERVEEEKKAKKQASMAKAREAKKVKADAKKGK